MRITDVRIKASAPSPRLTDTVPPSRLADQIRAESPMRLTLPLAIDIPIVGNARIRAAACTGQDEKTLMAIDEIP
jgi:hypothetical protein